jgi:hypothetical protein
MPRSTFLGLLAVSLTFTTIFLVGFIRNEQLQEQQAEQNRQYICDAYAYDQENAPLFCTTTRSYDSVCDLDDVPEDECSL